MFTGIYGLSVGFPSNIFQPFSIDIEGMDVPLCFFSESRNIFKARVLDCQTQYLPQIQLHLSIILDDSTDIKKGLTHK